LPALPAFGSGYAHRHVRRSARKQVRGAALMDSGKLPFRQGHFTTRPPLWQQRMHAWYA
jgi:hypothetical protein